MIGNQIRFPILATILDRRQEIIGGPFAGLRCPHSGTVEYGEVIGTYEQCLIPIVESVIRRQPMLIIDVGAGWGYYALGLAMRCPKSSVIAYEMDESRAQVIRDYRTKNHTPECRLQVRGKCTAASLQDDLTDAINPFVLMDAEGCEDFLLLPKEVPELSRVEILVEVHEMFVPGITARLHQRFQKTHAIRLIEQVEPEQRRLELPGLPGALVRLYWSRLTNEWRRQKMCWLHMQPFRANPTEAPTR